MDQTHSLIRTLNRRTFESFGEDIAPARQALNLAFELADPSLIAQSQCVIGSCLMIRGRTREAQPLLAQAEGRFITLRGDPDIEALQTTLETALGMVCDDLSDYGNALVHHDKAVQLARSRGDSASTRRALIYLGYAHFKLGHGEAALGYMVETLHAAEGAAHLSYVAYDFIADLLEQQGLWDFVLEQRLKGLEFLAPHEHTRTARVQCGIARCLLNLKRMDEAREALLKAEAALSKYSEPVRSTIKLFEAKSLYHLRAGDFTAARHFQGLTAAAAEDCGSIQFADDARLLRAEIELAEGKLALCQALCTDLGKRKLSFHRRLALDGIRENLLRMSGNWAEAYHLHVRRESSHRADLSLALQRKEDIHRFELEALRTRALIDKNQQLEKTARERDDLMHLVVHDMANYLQVTRNSMEVVRHLNQDATAGSVRTKQTMMVRSLGSLDMIEAMLEQLRLLWQVDSDRLDAVASEVQGIFPLIESVMPEYVQMASSKKQTLKLDVRAADLTCQVNPQHFNQIISNLLSNAIKYSGQGASTTVTVDKTRDGARASIRIEDQGQGMSPEDIKSAFQRFRRLSAKPTGGESSNGLGLYLVKRLAEPMRGELSVSSRGKNLGSVFTLELPLTRGSPAQAA